MPLVSIVIPTYNRAGLIGETLSGVVAQTVGDWECLVIDDGSADDTRGAVEPFTRRDPRIRYFPRENAGRSAAWAYGISQVAGEFTALLDSDDVWLPDFLKTLLGLLAAHPKAALAAAPCIDWDGGQLYQTKEFTPDQIDNPLLAMIRRPFLVPSQCLVRSDALQQVKCFEYWPCDDYFTWLQITPRRGAVLTTQPLVKYRLHGGNTFGANVDLEKLYLMVSLSVKILGRFALLPQASLYERLLALGNRQRKQEQLLELDMELERVPPSRLQRWLRLLTIVPTPLVRSPHLSRRYLAFQSPRKRQI